MTQIQKEDLYQIQIRLFRLAQIRWNLTTCDCRNLFKKYSVYDYIETCYEVYHIQGDEENLKDMEKYLKNQGCKQCI